MPEYTLLRVGISQRDRAQFSFQYGTVSNIIMVTDYYTKENIKLKCKDETCKATLQIKPCSTIIEVVGTTRKKLRLLLENPNAFNVSLYTVMFSKNIHSCQISKLL